MTHAFRLHAAPRLAALSLAAAALLGGGPAHAEGWSPDAWFVQAGYGAHNINSLNAGVVWPWSWKSQGGGWGGYTELLAAGWNADAVGGGRKSFAHVALSPIFRYRFEGGTSPFFVEAGIGVSYTAPVYVTKFKTFSTQFQFADTIGVGRSFGDNMNQDVTLRLQHLSNAGFKRPNPGVEYLQLRYTRKF
ncbi:MAG: acyloxyacyl hydrolase [Bdellovibrionales bacterium]|nr:acyloxyacyl hydrolase [Ramlibacter sp.]